MNEYPKTIQEAVEQIKAALPKVAVNKNGYEIRTQMLEMAQSQVWQDFHAKFAGWEQTITRDEKTNEVIVKGSMPEVPGTEKVLEAAQKFYAFVTQTK